VIDRIILFKLLDPSSNSQVADELRAALSGLPGLRELSVGLPADAASAKSWDLSCILRFFDLAAHDAALSSASFNACIETGLQPRCAVIKAWSFAQK